MKARSVVFFCLAAVFFLSGAASGRDVDYRLKKLPFSTEPFPASLLPSVVSENFSDEAYARRVRKAVIDSKRVETPADREYEAFLWREKAEGIIKDSKTEADRLSFFTNNLHAVQIGLSDVMDEDYQAVLRRAKAFEDAEKRILTDAGYANEVISAYLASFLYDETVAAFSAAQALVKQFLYRSLSEISLPSTAATLSSQASESVHVRATTSGTKCRNQALSLRLHLFSVR